jgi:predicted amidohydrolase YtcJ
VYTVSEDHPWSEAAAVEGKQISFAGSDTEATKYTGENTEVTDLVDRMMLPGLSEGHFHPIEAVVLTVGDERFLREPVRRRDSPHKRMAPDARERATPGSGTLTKTGATVELPKVS